MTDRDHAAGRRDDPEAGTGDATRLTPEETFTLLRNERRRAALRRLRTEPETTLTDLSERVAAAETDTSPERLSAADRKRVYISLYQTHLPALAEAGVVDYDRDRGTVARLPAADELDRRLDRLTGDGEDRAPGRLRYAGVAAGLVVVAGAAGLPPFGALRPAAWAVVGVAVLGVLAAVRRGAERSYSRS